MNLRGNTAGALPVANGGTGATNGPEALKNLGLTFPLPVSQGGTGASSLENAGFGFKFVQDGVMNDNKFADGFEIVANEENAIWLIVARCMESTSFSNMKQDEVRQLMFMTLTLFDGTFNITGLWPHSGYINAIGYNMWLNVNKNRDTRVIGCYNLYNSSSSYGNSYINNYYYRIYKNSMVFDE